MGPLQLYDLSIRGAIRRTFFYLWCFARTTSSVTRLSKLLITDKKNCVGFPFLGVKAIHGNCRVLSARRIKHFFSSGLARKWSEIGSIFDSKTCFQFPRKFLTRREKPETFRSCVERGNGHLNGQRGMKSSLSSDIYSKSRAGANTELTSSSNEAQGLLQSRSWQKLIPSFGGFLGKKWRHGKVASRLGSWCWSRWKREKISALVVWSATRSLHKSIFELSVESPRRGLISGVKIDIPCRKEWGWLTLDATVITVIQGEKSNLTGLLKKIEKNILTESHLNRAAHVLVRMSDSVIPAL